MEYLAHSADIERGIPVQTYPSHIEGVCRKCEYNLEKIRPHLNKSDFEALSLIVLKAARWHDLGKLGKHNQIVLRGEKNGKMPNHVDAGTAHLISEKHLPAAWMVVSHHRGYCDYSPTGVDYRDENLVRDRTPWVDYDGMVCDYFDEMLPSLVEKHSKTIKDIQGDSPNKLSPNLMRIALSCLVDADWHDTAQHYGNFVIESELELDAEKRLKILDTYIHNLQKESENNDRNRIRASVYGACRNSPVEAPVVCCPSEVGTGKTTALMAYALKQNPRKIIYVAPFCSIISQSVNTYRKLLLPNEGPETVGEYHHQVEDDEDVGRGIRAKALATTCSCPIVCTTAVQFFESLLACRTRKLRKLHNFAGSFIIIDESHISIPLIFWPLALKSLKYLVENLGCKVLFSSGSLIRPWEDAYFKELSGFDFEVPSIIPPKLSKKTLERENGRVEIRYSPWKHTLQSVCRMISKPQGPKLAVFNTIKNAAIVAKTLYEQGKEVEHLSTCLTPKDRQAILDRVIKKLKNRPNDDWILVATSCVECGIDFSFRYGFREIAGLDNAHQCKGRINREGLYRDSFIQIFELEQQDEDNFNPFNPFTENPEFQIPAKIFRDFYKKGTYGPEMCDAAAKLQLETEKEKKIKREPDDKGYTIEELVRAENAGKLRTVGEYFRVINALKFAAVIDPSVLKNDPLSRNEITRNSVQIYEKKKDKCPVVKNEDGFYIWKGAYDPNFLGYMAEFI